MVVSGLATVVWPGVTENGSNRRLSYCRLRHGRVATDTDGLHAFAWKAHGDGRIREGGFRTVRSHPGIHTSEGAAIGAKMGCAGSLLNDAGTSPRAGTAATPIRHGLRWPAEHPMSWRRPR